MILRSYCLVILVQTIFQVKFDEMEIVENTFNLLSIFLECSASVRTKAADLRVSYSEGKGKQREKGLKVLLTIKKIM